MLLTLVVSVSAVVLCVIIHYELIVNLTKSIASFELRHRSGIVFGALRALVSHVVHVLVFAFGYWLLLRVGDGYGVILGTPAEDFSDWVYFSFVVYTTLGFGDMVPDGWVRFMVGIQAVTGLVMITWTASFLFLELQKTWSEN